MKCQHCNEILLLIERHRVVIDITQRVREFG